MQKTYISRQSQWWKDAVVYQIYPRSFLDTNGDGIGDLNGITLRLDYVQALGANVIWLCPVYASPNDDNGYDISDYRAIHPDFGTRADFERLLGEAHRRGIRIVMDLVVNHTSDEHAWFTAARADRNSPYRDYYIWRDGRNGTPPNNWGSWFGGSAWEYDEASGQYYLHIFSKKQPDLNWENPAVRGEVFDLMRWWLDQGVDGFRMDVISLISKPEGLPDGPPDGEFGDLSPLCLNGPRVHEYLREMNAQVLSRYDNMTVGETPNVTPAEALRYAGFDRGELNMVFSFDHTSLSDGPLGKWSGQKTDLGALKAVLANWQLALHQRGWNCLFWSNHDQPRAVSKFGDDRPAFRARSAKMLATCLYLMQGTPYIFQGEELGMTNAPFETIADCRDIESVNAYHRLVDGGSVSGEQMMRYIRQAGRDNARTPMQWTPGAQAGFTAGTPWIGVNPNYRQINAEAEQADSDSVLCYYRALLRFRRNNPVIRDGDFVMFYPESDSIFAYSRQFDGETLCVFCNFTDAEAPLPYTPPRIGQIVLRNYSEDAPLCSLRPYEAVVYYAEESGEC
ncbi:MAG: alpha-glucosidase [Eubacteriales bacterium]|nr:alpha-glucosidase [Eubacteriales bacterium]